MDPLALCAETTAGWHASWLAALGLRSERSARVWRALDAPPFIYWTAVTLAPEATESDVADVRGTLCDSWSRLELAARGFEERVHEPWFVRPAGPPAAEEPPPGVELVRVSTPAEVAEFEEVSVRGFGGEDASAVPGELHPASILADARMTMLTARLDGRAAAAAMRYRGARAVGIHGVTTVASARGRGLASTLTRALIDPALPAVLSPTPEAERLYRRLGFDRVGELRMWHRP